MSVRHGRWFCVLAAALAGCAGSTVSDVIILPDSGSSDDVTSDVVDAGAATPDAGSDVGAPDVPPPPVRCGDGVCSRPTETCTDCPLDCNRCPVCDMAPTCTGALAVPTTSTSLAICDNTLDGNQRTNYSCGTGLGVSPDATTCTDPLLRIRVKEISIQRGFFDVPRNLYCVISAEDGRHTELLLTAPREVAGNRNTTRYNLPVGQSLLWGQTDLYRSISNITISYSCYLASSGAAAQRVLDAIAGRAGMAAEHADGYGWVFGAVSVLGTILGSSLSTMSDSLVLEVQQTISASALLTMTNGRTWEIRQRRGNLDLSGASDTRITLESWGCANVRTVVR